MTDIATPELVLTRTFSASIERVWQAWIEPAAIAQWLGPKGATTHILEADIRTGGVLRFRMDTEHGSLFAAFLYREVSPPGRLVYEHCFADEAGTIVRPPFFAVWPLKLLSTATFRAVDRGTQVMLRWQPLDATPEEEAAFAKQLGSMQGGWTNSFDQLDTYLTQ